MLPEIWSETFPVDKKNNGFEISFASSIHALNEQYIKKKSPFRHKVYTLNHPDYVVVISLDGGGVRGVIPAMILDYIEKVTSKKITEIGDVFSGSSAGSIVAGFLNIPTQNGKQMYSCADAVKLSGNIGQAVFKNPMDRKIKTLFGIVRAKYSAKPFEKIMQYYTKDARLRDAVKPLLITAINAESAETFTFATSKAYISENDNHLARDAIRASIAAPSYFKPLNLKHKDGKEVILIDGGLSAMSPELLAYTEALSLYPEKKVILLSIATGHDRSQMTVKTKGDFAGSLFDAGKLLMKNVTIWQQDHSNQVMRKFSKSLPLEYYRIDVEVPAKHARMDDASVENMQALKSIGSQTSFCNIELRKFLQSLKNKGIINILNIPKASKMCGTRPSSPFVGGNVSNQSINKKNLSKKESFTKKLIPKNPFNIFKSNPKREKNK